ncbi:uncharacterized protein EI97DRAFT_485056 [Westerdykella ornata]|uniref:Protein kinase domain-containing protein n=1 Tax=Westerdykella ornata TaxID=318751 RepID=A0A6A6J7V7_WESOR|nr:uncharacterized protein EI97DRAFT_485056 [Westerdykella ornata]KAF2272284.1 hypothetical protein EI97DRAFT_485056 [Westerdykella ornata]
MLQTSVKVASATKGLVGATGRRYIFKQLIQVRQHVVRVRLATPDHPLHPHHSTQHIPRQLHTCIQYLTDDFLSLVRKQIPMHARKQILKGSLRGIVELHDRDIVHLDFKPNNILVNCHNINGETIMEQAQVADIEDAAYLPIDRCIKGMLLGNDNWRGPEAHFCGELNRPADIFAFGAVCIYAMLGRVIFGVDDDFRKHQAQGVEPDFIHLQRQVSYFGDQEGLNGLIEHVGDEEVNCQILQMLWEDRNEDCIPYEPFSNWPDIDDERSKISFRE